MSDLLKMHSTALPCSGCTDVDDVNKPPFNLGALSISFSGCGFLGIYHMGVAAALRQYIPGKLPKELKVRIQEILDFLKSRFAGDSGSWVLCGCLGCGLSFVGYTIR
jgi:hypothetical protein